MFYAQLNDEKICICISQLAGKIDAEYMIELDYFDESVLGRKYNNDNWEDVPQPEPDPESLSEQEQAVLDTVINTDYLVCLADLEL